VVRYVVRGVMVAVGGTTTGDGVTAAEAVEAAPVPPAFVARTVNVYGVPLVSAATQQDVPTVEQVLPPGEDVTV
jgi:hypothetical protein